MTRPSDFIKDNPVDIVQQAVKFLENRYDDFKHVVPEAVDFKRECQHFLKVLPPKLINDAQGEIIRHQEQKYKHENIKAQVTRLINKSDITGYVRAHWDFVAKITGELSVDHGEYVSLLRKQSDGWWKVRTLSLEREEQEGLVPGNYMEVVTREEAETAILEAAVVADDNTHESDDEDDLQGEAAIIWDILKRINAANELIRDFLGKEKQKKTLDEKISWYTTRRPLHAKNLREYCRSESNAIRLRLNDLLLCLQLNEMAEKRKAKDIIQEKNEDPPLYHSSSRPHHHDEKEEDQRITATPKADDFKKDMSTESYGFWTTYFKQQVRVEWKAFIDAYQLVYGTLETSNRIYIERVLVPRNDDKMITIYGFMAFVVDHDFPFVQNIAGVRTPTTPTKSERHSPTRTDSETEFLPPYSKINDFSLGVQLFEPDEVVDNGETTFGIATPSKQGFGSSSSSGSLVTEKVNSISTRSIASSVSEDENRRMVATLKELLEKQKFLLKNLQVEKQHCQSDNKALSKRIQVVTTESRHRTKDIEQLRKRGVDTLVMLLKGEKVKNISKKIQQLQQDIHTLASSLLEQCDTDVATKAFSIFWLNLKEPIAAMGDPLPLKRILTLTEKFMMDVLVDLFILNENPGFNIQEKYHQLSVWIYDNATDPEDTYLGGLLRQEIARICDRCRKDKTSDLYQTHCEVLQNKWKYMYSGLVKAFPFVYQNDKAEPDIKKHYGARVHSLVEQAIDIGMSIRSQAMDIYAVAVEEGTQALDTGMMLDVDGHTSGTIALCIFPPILASAPISSDVDTSLVLAVGRMLCI